MFFLLIFPLKEAKASQILGPQVQRCQIGTAGSLTPLYRQQRCH
jgi:hypothetical protein